MKIPVADGNFLFYQDNVMGKHEDENEANRLYHGYAVVLFGNHEQFLMVDLL